MPLGSLVTMIEYSNGLVAMRGDHVVNDGVTAIVDDVVDTPSKVQRWGADAIGLILKSKRLGLVFVPLDCIDRDCFEFVRRSTHARG